MRGLRDPRLRTIARTGRGVALAVAPWIPRGPVAKREGMHRFEAGGTSRGAGGSAKGAGGTSSSAGGSAKGAGGTSRGAGGSAKGAGGTPSSAGGSAKGAGGARATTDGGVSSVSDGAASAGAASAGCGKEKPAAPPKEVDVAGTKRTFLVDVPANYDKDTPTPVLFAFHGMGITASFFRDWAKLVPVFKDYIVVHPDAVGDPTEWDSVGTKDFAFFDAMLASLESTYCFDTKRMFATGHSSGGYFTNSLGCQRGRVIRGIAPQSGAGPIGSKSCAGPLAVIIIHGSKDTSVPPTEGSKSRDYWGKAAGCSMGSSSTSSLSSVCVAYDGCKDGYPLTYCPYDGDHNLWKDAGKVMFDFFNSL